MNLKLIGDFGVDNTPREPLLKDFGGKEIITEDDKENEEKIAYFDKVIVRNVEIGKSTLDETGVFGEVKNLGNRSLRKVEITIFFLAKDGKPVFEKKYHPVLVLESSWSFGDNEPLRANYSGKFGVRLDNAPSDWAKKVKVKVTNIEFEK